MSKEPLRNVEVFIGGQRLDVVPGSLELNLGADRLDVPPKPTLDAPIEMALTITSVDGYPVADAEEGAGALFDSIKRIFGDKQ